MRALTAILAYRPGSFFERTLLSLTKSSLVESVVVVCPTPVSLKGEGFRIFPAGPFPSGETLGLILAEIRTKYLLLFPGSRQIVLEPRALERIVATAESTEAGIVYSDFYDGGEIAKTIHPLNDYQTGSVRDDFNFGSMILLATGAARNSLEKYGPLPPVKSAGLYDLRLKVSIGHSIHHLGAALRHDGGR